MGADEDHVAALGSAWFARWSVEELRRMAAGGRGGPGGITTDALRKAIKEELARREQAGARQAPC